MSEILLLALIVFIAYLFVSTTWFSKSDIAERREILCSQPTKKAAVLPEDSVLRRHFIAQLRNQIEREMHPRPADPSLRRLYESMVDDELSTVLAKLAV